MTIGKAINKLRSDANLSQEQFATLFGVSQQSVQKWENGDSVPELGKIIKISKHFGVSLDALILGNDNRIVEEMKGTNQIKPQYANIHDWEFYSSNLMTEYQQSIEEGLDIEAYKDVFWAAVRLPKDEHKKKIGDTLFEIVINAKQKECCRSVSGGGGAGRKAASQCRHPGIGHRFASGQGGGGQRPSGTLGADQAAVRDGLPDGYKADAYVQLLSSQGRSPGAIPKSGHRPAGTDAGCGGPLRHHALPRKRGGYLRGKPGAVFGSDGELLRTATLCI